MEHNFSKMMTKYLKYFFLFLALISYGVFLVAQPTNTLPPIQVISSIEEYQQQTVLNPDMKLVNLIDFINGLKLDIRYATTNNFTKQQIYTSPEVFLRKPVALALAQVQDSLSKLNLGLIIFDAYRPYSATVKFYEIIKDTRFVADPKVGSKHNRGCAVDVALYDLKTGEVIPMPTEFDDFSEKAGAFYKKIPKETSFYYRDVLAQLMQTYGFSIYPDEWWHFDYQNWEKFPLMDISFEELIMNNE